MPISRAPRITLRGFAAAAIDRLTASFRGTSMSADGDIIASLPTLRNRSRQLCMDVDFARRYISLVQQNVAGPHGVQIQARLVNDRFEPDPADSAALERAWRDWGHVAEVGGKLTWPEVQRLVVGTVARDGECLVRMYPGFGGNKYRFGIQVLEADYLDENLNRDLSDGGRITAGIEKDGFDRVQAYYLATRTTPNANGDLYQFGSRSYLRVPAEEIVHLFKTDRPQQTRGVTWLVTAIRRLNMLSALEEAALVNQRIAASKMGFFTSPAGDEFTGSDTEGDNDGSAIIEDVEPGTFTQLPAGMDFRDFDPTAPDIFPDFQAGLLRGAASGLGIGYSTLSMDNTSASYSSLRHEALSEQDTWRTVQRWFVDQFIWPVYTAWLNSAVMTEALPMPPRKIAKALDRRRVFWQPRGWAWVDPSKEAKANAEAVSLGTASRREIAAAQGKDLEEVLDQLAEESRMAEARGILIDPQAGRVAEQEQLGPKE